MLEFKVSGLLQIAIFSLGIMIILSSIVSGVIANRLDRNIGLLENYDTAVSAGINIKPSDPFSITSVKNGINDLKWITYGSVGSSLIIQYLGLFGIIWFISRTIRRHRQELEQRVRELTSLNNLFQQHMKEHEAEVGAER